MFLLFFVSGETPPDYIYIPPKSPFEKGGLLGGFSQPLYKKGQQLQHLPKTS